MTELSTGTVSDAEHSRSFGTGERTTTDQTPRIVRWFDCWADD